MFNNVSSCLLICAPIKPVDFYEIVAARGGIYLY